jgi:hypothetical protein
MIVNISLPESHSISKMESGTVPTIYTYAYLSTKLYDVNSTKHTATDIRTNHPPEFAAGVVSITQQ